MPANSHMPFLPSNGFTLGRGLSSAFSSLLSAAALGYNILRSAAAKNKEQKSLYAHHGGDSFLSSSPISSLSSRPLQDSSAFTTCDDSVAAGNPADGRTSRRPPVGFVVSVDLSSV
jgi:hypothetical protein